jgi:hypothetical protein
MRVVKASQRQRFVGASTGIGLAAPPRSPACARRGFKCKKWWVLACPVSVPNWRADTDAAENYEWPLAI